MGDSGLKEAPPRGFDIKCTQNYWDMNASTWDEAMGDGSPFQKAIVEPKTLEFLNIRPGMKILDIACGNGQMSRTLASLGASVTAFDISEVMIARAQKRSNGSSITYYTADASKTDSLGFLKDAQFDSVLCNMALMDIENIEPVFQLAYRVLKESGTFVFSITHPCFDKGGATLITEIRDCEGAVISEHSVKVQRYLTPYRLETKALPTFPSIHDFFHRPIEAYLNAAFKEGFAMCGIAEPSFPQDSEVKDHRGRYKLLEIPVVFIVKLQKLKQPSST